MSEHTPTPWAYRPVKFDDWGYLRGPKEPGDFHGPIVAIARGDSNKSHDEHRRDGTDPYEPNAAFIVKAVNAHEALLEFFRWAMREGPWDGGDLDGGSVQDKAEALGLIVKTQYDAEKHGVQSDFEHGDDWFEYAPHIKDAVGKSLTSPSGKP